MYLCPPYTYILGIRQDYSMIYSAGITCCVFEYMALPSLQDKHTSSMIPALFVYFTVGLGIYGYFLFS